MQIKNLSLAFYSAIFTAFAIKLADKFKDAYYTMVGPSCD